VSGRIGSNRDASTVVGASAYRSLLNGVTRERVGVDVQHYMGRTGVLAEVSVGSDSNRNVRNGLIEINRINRRSSWLYYTQLNYFSTDRALGEQHTLNANVGIKYAPDSKLSISAQLTRGLRTPTDDHPTTVSVQARYRL